VQWQPDSKAFTFTKQNQESNLLDIYRHDVKSGENTLLLAGADLIYENKNTSPSTTLQQGFGLGNRTKKKTQYYQ